MTLALPGRASARTRHRPLATPVRKRPAAAVRRSPTRAQGSTSWEIRSFVAVIAFIATLFVVAVLYLGQTTAVSAHGYELQRLTEQRDELRRQNSLLEVRIAKLDSPTRIETDAVKLGLVRARSVPIVPAEELAARR